MRAHNGIERPDFTPDMISELKAKAIDMEIEGPGLLLMGPAVASGRFFDTLNRIEERLNEG